MPPQVALTGAAVAPEVTPAARRSGNVAAAALSPALPGPLLLEVRRFADARGVFAETYSRRYYAALGIPDEFVPIGVMPIGRALPDVRSPSLKRGWVPFDDFARWEHWG